MNKIPKTLLLSVSIPFFFACIKLCLGHLIFWYDPARDLLNAWDNLNKITLIGPTSGIPGLFYGPYWIWLLSFGLSISKNPLVVTFITATLPYMVLFPFIWFKFSRFFGFKTVLLGWFLFIFSSGFTYATELWNPYPAPLLTIAAIYLLITLDLTIYAKKNLFFTLLLGFLLGLLINFHISFGIGLLLGTIIFILWNGSLLIQKKQSLIIYVLSVFSIVVGFFLAFLPTLVFETRHGFHQITTLLNTFTHYGAVTTVKGLSKQLLLQETLNTFAKLIHMESLFAGAVLIILLTLFIRNLNKHKLLLSSLDKKLLRLLISLFSGIGFIYFTAKNPVWSYHFIGVDVLFLILLCFLLSKLKLFRIIFFFWSFIVVIISIQTLIATELSKPSYFLAQKAVAETIITDSGKNPYVVATYTTSSYSFENSYFFRWLAQKEVPVDPNLTPDSHTVYLVMPLKRNPETEDFINHRTPSSRFKTVKIWNLKVNKVIKRVKIT